MGFIRSTDRWSVSKDGVTKQVAKAKTSEIKKNQHVKSPKRCDAPYIVTNIQEGRVRVRMLPPTVAQKKW